LAEPGRQRRPVEQAAADLDHDRMHHRFSISVSLSSRAETRRTSAQAQAAQARSWPQRSLSFRIELSVLSLRTACATRRARNSPEPEITAQRASPMLA